MKVHKHNGRPAGQLIAPPGASIHPHHWQEWLASAVNPQIINANVRSIDDPREVDELLNLNTDRRWKHSDHLVPGWAVTGVDPASGSRWGLGVQFKPDSPPPKVDKAGRPVIGTDGQPKVNKYLGAAGEPTEPLFLDNGLGGYWPATLATPTTPIHIVEGAKKAAALLSRDLAAISISGCWNGQKAGKLNKLIRLFATKGRPVYLWPDQDWHDKALVRKGWINLGRLLTRAGCDVHVCTWDKSFKGIDDYLAAHPGEDVNEFIEGADGFREWAQEARDLDREQRAGMVNLDVDGLLRLFRGLYRDRLRFNLLTQCCELDGEPLDPDLVHVEIGDQLNVRAGRENVVDVLTYLAKQSQYNPVVEYLDRVAAEVEPGDIDNLATRYLHVPESDPLAALRNAQLRKFLISCVARAYQPGVKVDTALILQGRQNLWKSTFFRILGGDWFDDSMGPLESKDDLMVAHRCWIQEWSEFDYISGQRHASQIKAFLSRQSDTFRPPYGRSAKTFPRRFVICGSTNQSEFLNDPTGSRRFWVIPVSQPIDIEALAADRDALWAAAVHAYRSGEQWWLTPDEFELSEQANRDYQAGDPWVEVIEGKLTGLSTVSTETILTWLDLDGKTAGVGDNRRVGAIMRRLGWERKQRRVTGVQKWFWEKCDNSIGDIGDREHKTSTAPDLEPVTDSQNAVTNPSVTRDSTPPAPSPVTNPSVTPKNLSVTPSNTDGKGLQGELSPMSPMHTQQFPNSEKNGVKPTGDSPTPAIGDQVETPQGRGKVIGVDLKSATARVALTDSVGRVQVHFDELGRVAP